MIQNIPFFTETLTSAITFYLRLPYNYDDVHRDTLGIYRHIILYVQNKVTS